MCIGQVEGAEILWANLVTGRGCGAPEKRLACFEQMYNKEAFIENKRRLALEKERSMGSFSHNLTPFVPSCKPKGKDKQAERLSGLRRCLESTQNQGAVPYFVPGSGSW
jgi:hypothetical protein